MKTTGKKPTRHPGNNWPVRWGVSRIKSELIFRVGLSLFLTWVPANGQITSATRSEGKVEDPGLWKRDISAFDSEVHDRMAEIKGCEASIKTKKDAGDLLDKLCSLDQYVMNYRYTPRDHGYLNTPAEKEFVTQYLSVLSVESAEISSVFKRIYNTWGWFPISVWGKRLDTEAWILTQHADNDIAFQTQVLKVLDELLKTNDTNPRNYAYLYDRVAVNGGRLQRFGTQGFCTGPGTWTPRPIEDEKNVDIRRKAMGLDSMSEYKQFFKNICQKDESSMIKPPEKSN